MKRREMLKTGTALTGAALLGPTVLGNLACGRAKVRVPSYLNGYEDLYAVEPR